MRTLLRDRNSRRYLFGSITSTIGDSALWLTLAIWVKVLTGSTSAAGLSIFMLTLGTLSGPFTGVLVDRVRRRPLLIVVNVLTGLLVSALLAVHSPGEVWLIDIVMFGYGVSVSIVGSAQTALTKSIVAEDLLGEANALLQTCGQGSRLITPLICAGLFTAFGAGPIIVADCATFLISTVALLGVRVAETKPVPSTEHWRRDVTAGVRHIYRTVPLRQVAFASTLALIAFGMTETVSFSVVTVGLHRPATFLGILLSGQGAGAILAAVLAPRLMRALTEGLLVTLGLAAAGASFLLQITANVGVVLAAYVLAGMSVSWLLVGISTLLQRRTPLELAGRANAALSFLLTTPQTIAIAVGAALVAIVDYRLILLAIGLLLALAAAYLVSRPEQHRQPEPVVEVPAAR
ncbi:MAG: MFS transporter [Actinomycetota bacterium]|nr:MFS transporter [Actinomycetota bacterium]MDQ2955394.1 MFS transporter [Actinomycetota bacterium]